MNKEAVRHITQAGLNLIKEFEGFSPVVYNCPADHPTIGYGHLIKSYERFECISESEAEDLLREDVQRLIGWLGVNHPGSFYGIAVRLSSKYC